MKRAVKLITASMICMLMLVSLDLLAQKASVRGRVFDADNQPLAGVGVVEKGTTNGVVTDNDGNYSISVSSAQATLSFSCMGFISSDVALNGRSVVDVVLQEDTELLQEAVAIGYGTVKKVDLAGSVGVVRDKAFNEQPITNVADLFQGRVAGVTVENSAIPGGSVHIRVRGVNSISKSNDPLVVVDGIVRESGLEGLNPDDVESIQVLKDASSTAIYGSRGSNGVIIITTKTGKSGKTIISAEGSFGLSTMAKYYDTVDPYTFAINYNKYKGATFSDSQLQAFKSGEAGTDWQKEITRTGRVQNYKLVVSSGNDKIQYYVSGNYARTDGVVIETNFERYSFHSNINSKLTDWLTATVDVNAFAGKGRMGGFGADKGNIILASVNFAPVVDVMNEDGTKYLKDPYSAVLTGNPVGSLKESKNSHEAKVASAHVDLKFSILPGLTFTTSNSVDYGDFKSYGFSGVAKLMGGTSSMSNYDNDRLALQSTNNLTYQNKWGKHSLTATLVGEASRSTYRSMGFSGQNLLVESVGWWNVSLANSVTPSNGYSQWTLLSGVGRVMYNYDDRYLLTATMRADGSSKFTNDKWGYFPSVALAWQLGNEKFMQNQNIFDDVKIRASYGVVGSQGISPYETLGLLSQIKYSFDSGTNYTGYWLGTNIATPDLTWEKTNQFDLGVDFSVLNRRLNVAFDYYYKRTKDGLLKKNIPYYDGGGTVWVNAGEISNKGFDLTLDGRIIDNNDFVWTSTFSMTYLKNRVEDLAGLDFVAGDCPMSGVTPTDGVTRIMEGYPVGTFYLYKWTGLDENGLDSYEDIDKDGKISANDRFMTGQATPKFTYGWNNSLSWRNWSLNMFFSAATGGNRLNLVRFYGCSLIGDSVFYNLKEAFEDTDRYPSPGVVGNNFQSASTKWLEKTDYIRLENLAIAYNISKSFAKFADIRLYFSIQNLFTISNYSGLDPQNATSFGGHHDINDGVDSGAYPFARTYTFGMKFNF